MPTYEYACSNCQNQWEEFQRISEPASTVCPKCKQETARRQISAGNFILKGGGWYADLYSSTKKSNGEGSKSSAPTPSSDSSSSSSPKADAAPAAAPAAPSGGSSSGGSSSSGSGGSSSGGGTKGSS